MELDCEHREPDRGHEDARAWQDEHREAGGEDEEARGRKGDPVEGATVDVAFPAGPQPPEQVVLVARHTRSVPATHAPNPAQNPAQIRH